MPGKNSAFVFKSSLPMTSSTELHFLLFLQTVSNRAHAPFCTEDGD